MKSLSKLIIVAALAINTVFVLARPKSPVTASHAQETQDAKTKESKLEQQIIAKEREGLDALKAGNVDRFAELTAEDAVLVDNHGPASKAQVVKNVAGFKLLDYTMEDVKFIPLS